MKGYFKSPPFFITVGILVFVGIIYYFSKDKYYIEYTDSSQIKIVNKWQLPRVLEEISGISYLDEERVACVQDEVGDIFIYNLVSERIENRINFADNDDFEGITTIKNKAYVLRSDGNLFKIDDITVKNPKIEHFKTNLSYKFDFEGLCYDKKNNRLLLAAKSNGPGNENRFKPVFEFNLATNTLTEQPVFELTYDNPVFEGLENAGSAKIFRTSEINIHPKTGEIYMLDGVIGKLLILDKNWNAKDLYIFNPDDFPQPEGLTFSPEGKMFISNEGEWDPANILEVELKGPPKEKNQKEFDSLTQ
ncbi:SdiA-regulated domain-containing protein [Mesonia sp.]|uniref:SdiA-regulated domain-containing protein n=1 Tax=Mesonia sp. TaxID=1960830 RepID=UPI001762774B|nr:SdiA-regulated domain-containing protein [Mesonia sp.]HIB38271.1 hypothetical protein [Mesonia sp.]HIO25974.1 hypothetical protein [Flavobacteriaceae bacterium]